MRYDIPDANANTDANSKILLILAPFWTPIIPPLGMSCLKGFLHSNGYNIKLVDNNTNDVFRVIYEKYFSILKRYIPQDVCGNYYKIGRPVLKNQMMAHIRQKDKMEYIHLVKILVFNNFYYNIDGTVVNELIGVLDEFFIAYEQYIRQLLKNEEPATVGISTYSDTLPASLFAFDIIKKINPSIKTIIGGGVFADQLAEGSPNFDLFIEETKEIIDKIIIGEGELLMLRLLEGRLSEGKRIYTREDLKGDKLDISTLNIPNFSDFDTKDYPYLASYTSRSCPFQCKFCSETVQWGDYRKKEAKQIAKELLTMSHIYNYQLFCLCDSLINPTINELAKELTNADRSVYWESCLRVDKDLCDPEKVTAWRKGGFYRAKIGIESGSQRIINEMNKKITLDQMKQSIYNLASVGIKTLVFIVIGFPSETEEDFQMTLEFIGELQDYIYEIEVTPFEYYVTGQTYSEEWQKGGKARSLYPENSTDMLLGKTWFLDSNPSREETYSRLNRIFSYLKKLGIPNLYSIGDIYKADERWNILHKNSVPSLAQFLKRDKLVNENIKLNKVSPVYYSRMADDSEFNF